MKLHLNETRPIIYLSGTGSSNSDEKALIKQGCRFRCFSYAYTCPGAFYYQKKMAEGLKVAEKHGVGIMMDSAAHSFHQLASKGFHKKGGKWRITDIDKLKEMVINQYVTYVKEKGRGWDFAVNFDYVKNVDIVYEMQQYLEKKGIRPIPVYHGDKKLEYLERYCKEGYKLIGIGTVKFYASYRDKKSHYDRIFNTLEKYGALAHGFAVTAYSLMFNLPWYSVDSATWAKVAAYGSILYADSNRGVIGEVHLTDNVVNGKTRYAMMPKDLRKQINETVEDSGFNIDELRTDGKARSLYNVNFFATKIMKYKQMAQEGIIKWPSLL